MLSRDFLQEEMEEVRDLMKDCAFFYNELLAGHPVKDHDTWLQLAFIAQEWRTHAARYKWLQGRLAGVGVGG